MRRLGSLWLLFALAVVAGLAEPTAPTTRKVWSDGGTNLLGGPSPDGKWISYVDPASGDLAVYGVESGEKRKLTRNDWVEYFCSERLGLQPAVLGPMLHELRDARSAWQRSIRQSRLSDAAQQRYLEILDDRHARLFG